MNRSTGFDTKKAKIGDIIVNLDLSKSIGARKSFKVKVYDGMDSLSKLKNNWDELAQRSNAPICMSFMWIENWWKHFGEHKNRSLCIVTIWSEKKLIAIAPMYKGYSTLFGSVVYHRLQLIGSGGRSNEQLGFTDDYGISDSLDFIVDSNYISPASELFAGWCRLVLSEVDTITFHQVQDQSFIKKHLYPKLTETDLQVDLNHTDTRPVIHLENITSLKEYVKQAKPNARRRFRQTLRAMKPDGQISVREFHSIDEVEEAMDVIIRLHQQRWNSQGYPGMFHDPRFTNFFKDIVRIAYYNNQLWFKHTTDEEGVSSSRLLLLFNRRYYDYLSGINIESPSSKYRPGYALLLDVIRESINSGVYAVDLLRGEEKYKFDFTETVVKNWKIVLRKNKKDPLGKQLSKWVVLAASYLYNHLITEKTLLKQHYENTSVSFALISYGRHRFERLLLKLKNE